MEPKTVTPFQPTALLLTAIWLVMVIVRFRRSIIVLIGGLFAIALYTLIRIFVALVGLRTVGRLHELCIDEVESYEYLPRRYLRRTHR